MQKTHFNKLQIIMLMATLVILGVSAIDIYIAALPQMVREFNTLPDTVNLTISAYTFGIAIGVLFIGELSNRFGRRKIILSGIICFSLSSFFIALCSSIYCIVLLRLIQALGCSSFIIIPRMIIRDTMNEKEQINANGTLLLGMIISPAIAPVIGAYISQYLGWRYCFVFSSVIGIIMSCIVYKCLPETNLSQLKKLASIKQYLIVYQQLCLNISFIALTVIYATTVGAYFAFLGISSYLYIDFWHLSPINFSYVYVLLAAAYFAGNYVMRALNKNGLSPARIIGIGVYSAFIGIVIIACANLLGDICLIIMVTLGVIFMRSANAIIIPPTQIRVMSNFAPHSAQALGLNMCIGFMCNSLATYGVTLLKFAPLTNLMIISIIPILISALFYIRFNKVL